MGYEYAEANEVPARVIELSYSVELKAGKRVHVT